MSELWLPGRPVPASRPRVVDGHAYTSERYRAWKQEAAWRAHRQHPDTLEGPVRLEIAVYGNGVRVEIQPSHTPRPKGIRGDLDNVVKGVADALQDGLVLRNDRQVHEIVARFGEDVYGRQ